MNTTTRAARSVVTPEVIAEIRRLRLDEGLTVDEVMTRLGIGRTTVHIYGQAQRARVNPERDAQIIALARDGLKQVDIAKRTGLHVKVVSDTLRWANATGMLRAVPTGTTVVEPTTVALGSAPTPTAGVEVSPASNGTAPLASLKLRLMRAVAEAGPFEDTAALIRSVRRPDDSFDLHEVQHLLASLNKQGYVAYRENKNGAYRVLMRIEATKRGFEAVGLGTKYHEVGRKSKGVPRKAGDRTDFRTHGFRAEGGPVEVRQTPVVVPVETPVETVKPVVASAGREVPPLLAALRERAEAKNRGAAKAARYLEAATLLEDVDVAEAERLLALAESFGGEPFTALETEYLAFAEAVEKGER